MTAVSVVVPTRDRRRLLAVTLGSVLAQERVELDVVVVDDASTDDTADYVAGLAEPRVRLVRNREPLRVSGARNRGIAEARGDWVAFIDDDDVWAPDKLARQLAAAGDAGSEWVYAGTVTVDLDLHVVHGLPPRPPEEVRDRVRRYNAVPGGGSNVAVRRSTLDQVGGFDTRLRNTEDWEMWVRLARRGGPAWVPRPLVGYRTHGENASLDMAEVLAGAALIEAKHGVRVDRGVIHRWLAESSLRTGRRRQALRHLAVAAVRGQAGGVAADLAAIARRRLGGKPPASRSEHDDWLRAAEAWLGPLRAAVAGDGPPGGSACDSC